jgi:polyhydroxyalkanoate synthesis regulator phasin
MPFDLPTLLETTGAAITGLAGAYKAVRHISSRMKKSRESYKQDIIGQAKEEMGKIERSLEAKIKILEVELETQKLNVFKDFSHFKETHNSEIKVLGEKIENLREDLAAQHQSLVNLLTRLVDNK